MKGRRLDRLGQVRSIAVPFRRTPAAINEEEPAMNPDESAERIVRLILGAAIAMLVLQIVGGLLKHAS